MKTEINTIWIDLNEEEQKIYDFLLINEKQLLDVISVNCNIPVYKLSSIFLQLEMKGVVKPLPEIEFSEQNYIDAEQPGSLRHERFVATG